jgi:hypothetical protein
MQTYPSKEEAIEVLKQRGYPNEFLVNGSRLECAALHGSYSMEEISVSDVCRYRGDSDPAAGGDIYALHAPAGAKGFFVDGSSQDYNEEGFELIEHLRQKAKDFKDQDG